MNCNPANLLAGIDNLLLDERKFDTSRDDIERICRFFSIGKLRHYEKEKGIIVSHSNFFVFVATAQGQYALKFYPLNDAKSIAIEYAINRILNNHHFPIPVMYAGHGGKPFMTSNDLLATCYSYIDGVPLWQNIKEPKTIPKINAAMLSLKNILSTAMGRVPLQKQANFTATINSLVQESRSMSPYDQKKMIDASLQEAFQTYRELQLSFTRQLVHNNITLTNMLIFEKTVHILDLSHIREDYALSDLASLILSCLFFDIPLTTIKAIAKNYFTQHKIETNHFLILNVLIKIGLCREYLKNIQREKSVELSNNPPELVSTYAAHLSKRKKSITTVLKKINDNPRLIV